MHGPNCRRFRICMAKNNGKEDDEREVEELSDIECDCEHNYDFRKQFDIDRKKSFKSGNSECYIINSLELIDNRGRQVIRLKPVDIEQELCMLADTGSTVGLCNKRMFEKYEGNQVKGRHFEEIVGIGGTVKVRDYLQFTFKYGNRTIIEKFYVLEDLKHDFIASRQFMKLNGYVLQRIPPEAPVYHHYGSKIQDPADSDEVFWAKAGTKNSRGDWEVNKILFGVRLSKKAKKTVKDLFNKYQEKGNNNEKWGEFPDFEFEVRFYDESKVHKQRPFNLPIHNERR